jgi:hypothetical protein
VSAGFSLRDFNGPPEPPPRRSLESGIDQVFRDAERAAATERNTPVRSEATADIHGPADVAKRIASLKRDGVEQLTDPAVIKAMKPEQIVQAQREGRLMTYMSGITAPASEG